MISSLRNFILKFAETLTGKEGRRIIEIILEHGEITDEEIGKILGKNEEELNEIRSILHRLYDSGILRYKRERDPSTGWFIYYWKIADEDPEIIYKQRKRKVLEKLKRRLNYEKSNTFYICPNRDIPRLTFEEAFNNMFRCPVCNAILEPYENSSIIKELEDIVKKLEKIDP